MIIRNSFRRHTLMMTTRLPSRHHLQGIDLNTSDYDGRTALHVAAAEGQLECVRFLLEAAEVDPNPQDRWKFTPVGEANRFGTRTWRTTWRSTSASAASRDQRGGMIETGCQ